MLSEFNEKCNAFYESLLHVAKKPLILFREGTKYDVASTMLFATVQKDDTDAFLIIGKFPIAFLRYGSKRIDWVDIIVNATAWVEQMNQVAMSTIIPIDAEIKPAHFSDPIQWIRWKPLNKLPYCPYSDFDYCYDIGTNDKRFLTGEKVYLIADIQTLEKYEARGDIHRLEIEKAEKLLELQKLQEEIAGIEEQISERQEQLK